MIVSLLVFLALSDIFFRKVAMLEDLGRLRMNDERKTPPIGMMTKTMKIGLKL